MSLQPEKMKAWEEEPGVTSSTRVAFLLIVFVVMACFAYVTWQKGDLPDIPNGVWGLLLLAFGGKVGQRHIEDKNA